MRPTTLLIVLTFAGCDHTGPSIDYAPDTAAAVDLDEAQAAGSVADADELDEDGMLAPAGTCGNGVVNTGETCDTAIAAGSPGACPTTCLDAKVCTKDVLAHPGTCKAACRFPKITTRIDGDACCPTGADATNDSDCIPPTAFRFSDLDLRDPHVFVNALGCHDVTDAPFFGFSVNGTLQTSIQTDGTPPDGKLDFSPTLLFRPLRQANGATTTMYFYTADCTSPLGTTSCQLGSTAPTIVTAVSQTSGTCLAPVPGTTHNYTPKITKATGKCFASSPTTVTLALGAIPVPLTQARIAATYSGSPASTVVHGLFTGFISEADANATILPSTLPLVGGQPLSSLFAGGAGNCAAFSDKDTNAGVSGWWVYLNFTAPKVPWSEM